MFLSEIDFKVPAIYIGEYNVPKVNGLFDTFLKMDKFNKVSLFSAFLV
jgi:hypothetical protein